MKMLWNYIDKKNWNKEKKFKIASMIICAASAFVGLIIWRIVSIWSLNSIDWMLCLLGYPIVISLYASYIYYCNHQFRDDESLD
ncbi:MAG: hypothetical protein K5656_00790 [Lachnospiraceae bacterium]|nr:hypothetical protein [Lachnospiraceae bacterium]